MRKRRRRLMSRVRTNHLSIRALLRPHSPLSARFHSSHAFAKHKRTQHGPQVSQQQALALARTHPCDHRYTFGPKRFITRQPLAEHTSTGPHGHGRRQEVSAWAADSLTAPRSPVTAHGPSRTRSCALAFPQTKPCALPVSPAVAKRTRQSTG